MTKGFAAYPRERLPTGFRYPVQFLEFANTGSYPDIGAWWFIDAGSKAGELMYSIRLHGGRGLVPFAKVDDGRDDIACFDGEDSTGDPQVFMLVLDDSGRRYSYGNFAAWLAAAQADA
nr:ORF118 [uncultured bacterium]